jgi:hypothetical protein
MSDPSLHQLERDVEAARGKLASDLTTLRSPATYTEFTSGLKEEALDLKDAMVDKAKSRVQSTIDDFVEDLKGRAAANPAAALAIGAGIAWRLLRHPPITTALVGVGLYSLFRTSPVQSTGSSDEEYLSLGKERLVQQASDVANVVKDGAVALGENAAEKTSELVESLKDRGNAVGAVATDKATDLAGIAKERVREWSTETRSSTQEMAGAAASTVAVASSKFEDIRRAAADEAIQVTSLVGAVADEYSRPLQQTLTNQESRDNLLLGAAGVAVVAALGIACQRRLKEHAEANN